MATRIFDETDLRLVKQVLDSGQLCSHGGTMVKRFEAAFAARMGATHAVAVHAAMSGLHAALMAAGVGPGVEVIVDPIVQFAGLAVLYANGVPVFADIDPTTLNVDPTSVASRITPHTRAIVVTHLCGLPAEMDPLLAVARAHELVVVEDCAHALLAEYRGRYAGTLGHVGVFSFQQVKHLATGDGGMVLTDDETLARAVREVCEFGAAPPRLSWNYRMAELVAAVGLAQLERSAHYVAEDRAAARLFDAAVAGCTWLRPQPVAPYMRHSYHLYALLVDPRAAAQRGVDYEAFKAACREEKAGFGFGYTGKPAYLHPVFAQPRAYGDSFGHGCPSLCPHYTGALEPPGQRGDGGRTPGGPPYREGDCPRAEAAFPALLWTAISPHRRETIARAADALARAIRRVEASPG